jgi:phage terminase large subunit-like protein
MANLDIAAIKERTRIEAENSLERFIEVVAPYRVLGNVHRELCRWWTRPKAKKHQLTLLPRDHGKSAMVAFRVAWMIVKRPDIRILYISSTANLAEKQLKAIKDILTSDAVRMYWPELIEKDEGKREKWTNSEISVDHPKRKEEGVRDPTVFTGGLTTSLTGLHCDIAVLDDVVVQENAYINEGREKVKSQYSLLSSIEGAEAEEWAVGTRYHPDDLYASMLEMEEPIFDREGNIIRKEPVYEVFERKVENRGDGTGEFLWPRQQRADGRWFGFDMQILATKKAKYLDQTQFRAQYYNDPNDTASALISRDKFKYYDKGGLRRDGRNWYFKNRRLNIIAAMDFAYSLKPTADYTCLAVAGVDGDGQYYVLEINRFKTIQIEDYFKAILQAYNRWGFRQIVLECSVAQEAIVEQLKNAYINPNGLALSVIHVKPTRHDGTKEERMNAILVPRYSNSSVWHYKDGNCQVLEDELVLQHPPHDDVKNALAEALDKLVIPSFARWGGENRGDQGMSSGIVFNSRFGGIG